MSRFRENYCFGFGSCSADQCKKFTGTCNTNLATCNTNLKTANDTWNKKYTQCNNDLGKCNTTRDSYLDLYERCDVQHRQYIIDNSNNLKNLQDCNAKITELNSKILELNNTILTLKSSNEILQSDNDRLKPAYEKCYGELNRDWIPRYNQLQTRFDYCEHVLKNHCQTP